MGLGNSLNDDLLGVSSSNGKIFESRYYKESICTAVVRDTTTVVTAKYTKYVMIPQLLISSKVILCPPNMGVEFFKICFFVLKLEKAKK